MLLLSIGIGLDNRLQTTNYKVTDNRIPAAFEGFKIAQLSDMHCLRFGEGQSELVNAVKAGDPDIIVLTGDIIDAYIQDYDSAAILFEGLTKIAPVYAVSGNHENFSKTIQAHMDSLYKNYGVIFLKDSSTTIGKDGANIFLYGMDDLEYIPTSIPSFPKVSSDTYGILLYHKSNQFDSFVNNGYGLVLSGHGHGGLIRMPFVGGIIAPEGELDFTLEYSDGRYTVGNTTLISNRGMAGSHNVPRIFNRPEVVLVTLSHAE